ncbi:MAG: phosphoribosylaminoimidazolesuccinocarboxamide synthase [Cyanobacteria bacterium P01_C01_bin.89]
MSESRSPSEKNLEKKLYEGKAKILYATDNPEILLTRYKDDATAFNAQKKGTIAGKGQINCAISRHLFEMLESAGVPTHFVDCPTPIEMRVKRLTIVPLEVIVRNVAAGSLCKQTGIELGTVIEPAIVEFCYKNDDFGDPLLSEGRIYALELATPDQVEEIELMSRRINELLTDFFKQCRITLVDFKLEFGVTSDGTIVLGDEISPDTCRLWDDTVEDPKARVLDKDRFRQDLGDVEGAYQRVLEKVVAIA